MPRRRKPVVTGPESVFPWVPLVEARLRSGSVRVGANALLGIRNTAARADQDPFGWTDLKEVFLPGNEIVTACRLADEEHLVSVLILTIDCHLMGRELSPSTQVSIKHSICTLAKIFEYGRLNSIYRIEQWTPEHFEVLATTLSKEGWWGALQLEKRYEALSKTKPSIRDYLKPSGKSVWVLDSAICSDLSTNAWTKELRPLKQKMAETVANASDALGPYNAPGGLRQSHFATALNICNWLSKTVSPFGLNFAPFPSVADCAKRLTTSGGRTANMSVDDAAALLGASCDWIYKKSPAVLKAIEFAVDLSYTKQNQAHPLSRREMELRWHLSPERKAAEEALGIKIKWFQNKSWARENVIPLNVLSQFTLGACFVAIVAMNARRKEELIHPKYGLHEGAFRIVDARLGVFEGDFYIEKTLQSYAPFYVNQVTFDAFQLLIALNEIHSRVIPNDAKNLQERTLFWRLAVPAESGAPKKLWFNFDTGPQSSSGRFALLFAGFANLPAFNAHVFRRFYAITFYYQFEHGTLQALSFQLVHWNLLITKTYVSDADITEMTKRIPVGLRRSIGEVKGALSDEFGELSKVMLEVGEEKLCDSIERIFKGEAFSGGFPKLLERLKWKLSMRLDFSELDAEQQAKRMADRILKRQHRLNPMAFNDCLAGTNAKARSSKCWSQEKKAPDQSRAEPVICSDCVFSLLSRGHVQNIEWHLDGVRSSLKELPAGSVKHAAMQARERNLERVVQLHRARVGN